MTEQTVLERLLAGESVELATAERARELGALLGRVLLAGDLVLLTGDLAAGKTTLTQGIGEGLGVRGPITSPTFVIARVHPNLGAGPDLVHVDAYRLGGLAELDDLDLDADLGEVVTVVEWGHGLAEGLAEDRLELVLTRHAGDEDLAGAAGDDPASGHGGDMAGDPGGHADAPEGDQPRTVRALAHGTRWSSAAH